MGHMQHLVYTMYKSKPPKHEHMDTMSKEKLRLSRLREAMK